jgi:hypothetical protein
VSKLLLSEYHYILQYLYYYREYTLLLSGSVYMDKVVCTVVHVVVGMHVHAATSTTCSSITCMVLW